MAEPHGALAEQTGAGRKWLTGDQVVPGMQVSGLLVSEQTVRDRALGVALVTAWLRGVRDFLPGQTSDQAVLDALGRWTGVPADVIRRAVPTYLDPNGSIDLDDLRRPAGLLAAPRRHQRPRAAGDARGRQLRRGCRPDARASHRVSAECRVPSAECRVEGTQDQALSAESGSTVRSTPRGAGPGE
jgi:hypothetical protein